MTFSYFSIKLSHSKILCICLNTCYCSFYSFFLDFRYTSLSYLYSSSYDHYLDPWRVPRIFFPLFSILTPIHLPQCVLNWIYVLRYVCIWRSLRSIFCEALFFVLFFFIFIFYLQFFFIFFNWGIIEIQRYFQMYNIVIQYLYTLWNDDHNKSSYVHHCL